MSQHIHILLKYDPNQQIEKRRDLLQQDLLCVPHRRIQNDCLPSFYGHVAHVQDPPKAKYSKPYTNTLKYLEYRIVHGPLQENRLMIQILRIVHTNSKQICADSPISYRWCWRFTFNSLSLSLRHRLHLPQNCEFLTRQIYSGKHLYVNISLMFILPIFQEKKGNSNILQNPYLPDPDPGD